MNPAKAYIEGAKAASDDKLCPAFLFNMDKSSGYALSWLSDVATPTERRRVARLFSSIAKFHQERQAMTCEGNDSLCNMHAVPVDIPAECVVEDGQILQDCVVESLENDG